jgi:prephenate dehydrogenase
MSETDPQDPVPFTRRRVAIVGLGLMGGSLAMALRGKCAALLGVDPDPDTLALAGRKSVVDQASADPGEMLPQADVIVLAAPVRAVLTLLADLPGYHPGNAIVIDLGSTKYEILQAMASLPGRFDPVGGHPICGKEKNGLDNASPDLFQGTRFVLSALPRTSRQARATAETLVQAAGAEPYWADPLEHDRGVAATSHLPYLLACALALATPPQAAPLVGPGFRSTTRVAASSPQVMLDILRTNRENLLQSAGRLRQQLDRLETALQEANWRDLETLLVQAAAAREELIGKAPSGESK